VVEINGVRQPFIGHQDTVNIPFQTGDVPGEVKVLIDFRDPIIVGKFPAHCHIGAHEDNGMMAVVEVVN
jgi:FtsP/CotA-like multicopper oxidase with cupredoxin domain